ncbi:COG3650 family protein [Caulobacter mirabilis]|uniref:Lipoprotein n=1 Tax=Caulobacter mirabilis TaxID=69666 RepID=A0A2D2AT51_9CAUL|nr:hypothetical protein [Caulobacter mirabilis]ATQ41188.1 hypothetical protein CSW64_01555 [Caulobacter mirabilis]
MRAIVALPLTLAALLLAACNAQEAPGGSDAVPPADAPPPAAETPAAAEFKTDFGLRGTEPFWSVDIKGGEMTLTRPEPPAVKATGVTFAYIDGHGVWTGQADGKLMVATLTKGDCSDGMSDLKYPYVAEVKLGAETLKGCGFKAGEQPKEGE